VALDHGDNESDGWADRLDELREDVEHHVEEEESEIFPLAQKLLDPTQLSTIADEIERAKALDRAAK